MPSILFVCTANQFRSPIAAACFWQQVAGQEDAQEWQVESAGTWAQAGLPAPDFAVKAAASVGVRGLRGHRTRQVDAALLERFDLVMVMESGHKESLCAEFPSVCERVYLLAGIVDDLAYDIPDPARRGVDPAVVASIISDLIAKGKDRIIRLVEIHRRG
jgi:protein-tyrosine phosphatase